MPYDLTKRNQRTPADHRAHEPDPKGSALQLKRALAGQGFAEAVQRLAPEDTSAVAREGTRSGAGALPHKERIQASFGAHDLGAVQAHVGGEARDATEALGARAFASGDRVAFDGAPDLHTAAHEAAHVIQQRGPHGPAAGLGAPGDAFEKHADAVADAVVGGRSAEGLLDAYAPSAAAAGAASGAAIQRYTEGNTYKAKPDEDGELFTRHDEDPSISDDPLEGLEYKVSHDAPTSLDVSDDGKLAIQPEGQAQEFFAEPGLVAGWNKTLAGGGTLVGLQEQGGKVKVGGHNLVQVKPTLDGERMSGMLLNECLHIANTVLGRRYDQREFKAIFEDVDDGTTRTTDFQSTDVNKTARHVLSGKNTDDPGKGIGEQKDKPVGKEYGKKLGKGKLEDRARSLGINQHANPEVGEAYVTYSVRGVDRAKKGAEKDYTGRDKPKKGDRKTKLKNVGNDLTPKGAPAPKRAWDMHYAGVVAKSGGDRVTLEDYNRSDEVMLLRDDMMNAIKLRYAKELEKAPPNANLGETITYLQQTLNNHDWGEARQLANKAVSASGKSTWYFKMYGPHVGQSFHEREHEAGDTVNPLTMRVGRRGTDTKAKEELDKQRKAEREEKRKKRRAKLRRRDLPKLEKSPKVKNLKESVGDSL